MLFIVCSFNIDLDVKQYSMYETFNVSILKELQETIDSKTALVNVPLVIEENMPFIDGQELFNDVTKFLKDIQKKLIIRLTQEEFIGTTLHISFVVGRLKSKDALFNDFPNKEKYIIENNKLFNTVKESFQYLNNKYRIEITDDELCYITNVLISK